MLPFGVSSLHKPWHGKGGEVCCHGTFHDLLKEEPSEAYADFIRVTGENSYQPVRREIYQARERVRNHITCLTSPFRSEHERSIFVRIFRKLDVRQANYFRLDMVEEYNRHKYAVVGEEISGFPALGSFEAMSSGAVLFGQKLHLQGLGLVPGRHFIDYDGTLEDLLAKMHSHAGENLASIAGWGSRYPRKLQCRDNSRYLVEGVIRLDANQKLLIRLCHIELCHIELGFPSNIFQISGVPSVS